MSNSEGENRNRHQNSNPDEVQRYHQASRKMETSYSPSGEIVNWENVTSKETDVSHESHMFDIDRMVNEGLGGGNITADNGFIGESTTDSMVPEVRTDEDV
ncbi:hypothetical protein [Paenibacillus azoreducens]|uniref:DUF4025 domain-containing protein n=1 Tax=Paenibacillus azoreducens TaxID=116718 RepID=A0A920CQD6_9BACL|nr:hypothetical protein [Paenibacillus azoreducens]GIO47200.1 hypothetical protein J34TS1_19650 [Paenibacillus azoreducens]